MAEFGRFHLHKKQRTHKGAAFHDPDTFKRIVDRTCLVFSVLMPLTTVPQIYLIYSEKHATGVSLLMWIFYCIGVIPFLVYGIVHKERQLIILNTLWMIAQIIMIIGILLYG